MDQNDDFFNFGVLIIVALISIYVIITIVKPLIKFLIVIVSLSILLMWGIQVYRYIKKLSDINPIDYGTKWYWKVLINWRWYGIGVLIILLLSYWLIYNLEISKYGQFIVQVFNNSL
jgi:hypothetical protein